MALCCGGDDIGDSTTQRPGEASAPGALAGAERGTTVVVDGLQAPTQFIELPDGGLVVAQLAGPEDGRIGEVLAVDPATGTLRVLLSGLDKPTGVAWVDGALYVMVRDGMLRAAWDGVAPVAGPVSSVLAGLPSNGRSEGTLTLLRDGRVLYETTATGPVAAAGTATLWALDPATGTSVPVATGTANAYGHAQLADGRVAVTEVSDRYGHPSSPVDELNVVSLDGGPVNLGWPACPGERRCEGVVGPRAVFPVHATPTGVAQIGEDLYVALYATGEIARLRLDDGGDPLATTTSEVVVDGLDQPHSLLARSDGSLLVSEIGTGRLLLVRP